MNRVALRRLTAAAVVVLLSHGLPAAAQTIGEVGGLAAPAATQPPPVLPVPREIGGSPVFVVLAPDAIRAIDDPTFVRGEAAARQMAEDESVLGVRLGGDARSYPLGYLTSHEIVNDRVGDTPVAVTW